MEACDHFNGCSANLCPKDEDIALRTWFIGEDICFVRRQKKLNKRRPPSMLDRLFTYQELMDSAPVTRVMNPEQKAKAIERLKRHHFGKKASPTCAPKVLSLWAG